MRQFVHGALCEATSQRILRARQARHALEARFRVGGGDSASRVTPKLMPDVEASDRSGSILAPFSLQSLPHSM